MTRSKDLVDTLYKSDVCINYADTLLHYDHWALADLKASASCPQEIADSKPAIVIIDNDDFKIETLSGDSTGAHRTNVMYVWCSVVLSPAVIHHPTRASRTTTQHTMNLQASQC